MTAFHEHAPNDMVWWEKSSESAAPATTGSARAAARLTRPPEARPLGTPGQTGGYERPKLVPAEPTSRGSGEFWSTHDSREQREREARLYHAQRMAALGELTSGICHDFNNLLTAIIGNLSEVVRSSAVSGDVREMLEDALSAAVDGANMTRRLGSREGGGRSRPVDFAESVGELGRMLKRVLKREVRLEMALGEDVAAVVDRTQLDSAVTNLVLNAQHALPHGGQVKLTVDRVGPRARIIVEDNGIGMDAETARRATEPFFTTRGDSGGTGLGLAMVQDFVTKFGGQLEIESTLGRGTSVSLYFPWVAEATPRTALPVTR